MPDEKVETDLVLPYNTHAFVLNTTTGNVHVHVGPTKKPLSPKEEVPVIMTPDGRFIPTQLDKAIKTNIVAAKGEYIILNNPAVNDVKPKFGGSSVAEPGTLRVGETVNIPGPASFALWPGQLATIVKGHQVRSNEYLLVRVYDEDAARNNWAQSTIKVVQPAVVQNAPPPTSNQTDDKPPVQESTEQKPAPVAVEAVKVSEIDPRNLMIGQQLTIKGTEVSFYIPPTGIEVIKDGDLYIRKALTLERLEYCLLVDEDGNKRYVRGPEVVFPLPTETFKHNDEGDKKSRAYELNAITGIHVKVIAPYMDAFGLHHEEGEEMFITGRVGNSEQQTQIYFPRVEHAILKYGGRTRYHAIAIPPGDARYVMNRLSGQVKLQRASMFLPDPREEVIVKRVLSKGEVETYYPGNNDVAQYNKRLAEENVEEEGLGNPSGYRSGHAVGNILRSSSYATKGGAGDVINRGTTFTPPRTITLDSKFEGAVQIRPWTGYAIQVVDSEGNRRIEVGPKTVQLEFDERLEVLSLSTGTPKSSDSPLKTVYLRISNNAVSDIFEVRTRDLIAVRVHLKYLVRFEENMKDKWFSIDNYIQNMVDRFRSLVNNYARMVDVQEFYVRAGDLLRDLILGAKIDDTPRSGYLFEENGMRVYELDVLPVQILDSTISSALVNLQSKQINDGLEAMRLQSELTLVKIKEDVNRKTDLEKHETVKSKNELDAKIDAMAIETELAKLRGDAEARAVRMDSDEMFAEHQVDIATREVNAKNLWLANKNAEEQAELDRKVKEIETVATADVSRINAISPDLVAALQMVASSSALEVVSTKLGDLSIVRQESLGATFETMFDGTPMAGFLGNLKKLGVGKLIEK